MLSGEAILVADSHLLQFEGARTGCQHVKERENCTV